MSLPRAYAQSGLHALALSGLYHLGHPGDPSSALPLTGHLLLSTWAIKVPTGLLWSLLNRRLLPRLLRPAFSEKKHLLFLRPSFLAKDFLLNHLLYQALFLPLWYAYFHWHSSRSLPQNLLATAQKLQADAEGLLKSRLVVSLVSVNCTLLLGRLGGVASIMRGKQAVDLSALLGWHLVVVQHMLG